MYSQTKRHSDPERSRRRLRFALTIDPIFTRTTAGVMPAHIEAVLAGAAEPNAALLAVLYPPDPDDARPAARTRT